MAASPRPRRKLPGYACGEAPCAGRRFLALALRSTLEASSKREYPAMIYFYVENMDEWYQRAVAAGATTLRPPTNEFYGDRVAGVLDAQGNPWWIATHVEDVPPDELARRAQARG
ncbi:MAG: hypothetical protein JNJ88_10225 [Planctomycetes bacterium]|nr:hypothetical protein [Planctomycetota bacterium]